MIEKTETIDDRIGRLEYWGRVVAISLICLIPVVGDIRIINLCRGAYSGSKKYTMPAAVIFGKYAFFAYHIL